MENILKDGSITFFWS